MNPTSPSTNVPEPAPTASASATASAALCEPCQGIQRDWRGAPGHPELRQGNHRKEQRGAVQVVTTGYFCDRCGTHWHYTNNKADQRCGWSLAPA